MTHLQLYDALIQWWGPEFSDHTTVCLYMDLERYLNSVSAPKRNTAAARILSLGQKRAAVALSQIEAITARQKESISVQSQ